MIYVTGDTHREFSRFSRLDLTKDDMIIVLGDVGINYYLDSSDDRVKKKLSKYPLSSVIYCFGRRSNDSEHIVQLCSGLSTPVMLL